MTGVSFDLVFCLFSKSRQADPGYNPGLLERLGSDRVRLKRVAEIALPIQGCKRKPLMVGWRLTLYRSEFCRTKMCMTKWRSHRTRRTTCSTWPLGLQKRKLLSPLLEIAFVHSMIVLDRFTPD